MKKKTKIIQFLKFILFSGWPVWLAILGSFIMIFAGVNDCNGCAFFENLGYMRYWGWVGFALFLSGVVFGAAIIIRAWINGFKN